MAMTTSALAAPVDTAQVACIGAGGWGKNLIRNFHALGALRWISDADETRRRDFSEQYPGTEISDRVLERPTVSAVVIATPAATHGALVRKALLADKDVFVEKPLCLSVEEGEELVALAKERNRILMVGHLLWYHPAVLKLRELVDAGELGRIQYIYSNRLNLGKIRREENILWSFAPHDVSVILGLTGEMPDSIQAHGANYLHDRIADVTISTLSFPSGVKAHIFVSWLHPFKEQKLVVVGDQQMAVFDDTLADDKLVLYPHSIKWKNRMPIPNRAEGRPVSVSVAEPLRQECQHFLECIERRVKPRTDGQEALRVLTVLKESQRCLDRG